MTVPLIILAAFSLFAGVLNPGFGILKNRPMDHWLEPVFKAATERAVLFAHGNDAAWAEHMELAARGRRHPRVRDGYGARLVDVHRAEGRAGAAPRAGGAGALPLVLDKWRVDELYEATVIAAVDSLAETAAAFDKTIVDGILARLTSLVVAACGHGAARLPERRRPRLRGDDGRRPRGDRAGSSPYRTRTRRWSTRATTTTSSRRRRAIGYAYRWDADGDGRTREAGLRRRLDAEAARRRRARSRT